MNGLRDWWSDEEHRRQTLYLAGIVAVFVLTLWFGPMVAGR